MNNVNVSREDARKFLEMLDSLPGNYTRLREQLAAKAYPEKIINLTPHDITILDEYNREVAVLPGTVADKCASVYLENVNETEINGVPVFDREIQKLVNLPEPEPNVYYVVSAITERCLPEYRPDILTVCKQVRDSYGRVIGCRGLAHMVR